MLRYNNQVGFSKPVDYFRPLTVDVSVEYELPKEVAPPPGSAPLLIIHPSAFYRSKSSSNRSNPQGILSPKPGKLLPEASSSSLSSSTYFLRSTANASGSTTGGNVAIGGLPLQNQHSIYSKSNQNPGSSSGTGKSSSSTRYSGNGIMNSSSISRSRSMTMGNNGGGESRGGGGSGSISVNCPYGKCDECASVGGGGGCGSSSSARVTSGVKKLGFHRQPQQDGDPFNYYNNLLPNTTTSTSTGMSISTGTNTSKNHQLLQHHQPSIISGSGNNAGNGIRSSSSGSGTTSSTTLASTTSTSANGMIDSGGSNNNRSTSTSNKRLRMMSQQQNMQNNSQQQLQQQQHQPSHHQISLGLVIPEPLNLAVAPSASNHLHLQHLSPSSIYLNQRSALYKQHQQLHSHHQQVQQVQQQQQQLHQQQQGNNHRNSLLLSTNGSMSGGNVSNGNNGPANLSNIQMINYGYRGSNLNALSNLYTTSNSATQQANRFLKECPIPVDKGSGSDSGVCSENDSDVSPNAMAPYHSSNLSRRSILSQELPTSGCYCCCCPTTSDNTSSSPNARKSVGGKVKSSSSVSKGRDVRSNSNNSSMYSGGSAYASMVIQESQLGNMLISCDSPMASGNSPMDSSSSPATYRKWFVGDTSTSQLGRWFQV